MPRCLLASNDVDNAAWNIAVRPGEKANLEIEFWGAMVDPTLVVNGESIRFPITLEADERLLCRNRRNWFVLDAQRVKVGKGKLAKKVPKLISGANQIVFTCASRGKATVKLTKVYK